jgi:hypothetical protein
MSERYSFVKKAGIAGSITAALMLTVWTKVQTVLSGTADRHPSALYDSCAVSTTEDKPLLFISCENFF